MATSENPPIFELAIEGWRYAFAALSRMPSILGIAMAIVFGLSIVTLPLLPGPDEQPSLFFHLFGFLISIVQAYFLTPVAIAVHRFVLLGELTERYAPNPSDPRFMRFFAFSVVYQLLTGVPSFLMSLTGKTETGVGLVLAFIFFVLLVIALIASLRLLILFPAIAVDARGADWRNAMADTKGHTWRVFFIMLVTSLPALIISVPLYFTLAWPRPELVGGIVLGVFQAVIGVLLLAACAAVASRLFAAFANKLNG